LAVILENDNTMKRTFLTFFVTTIIAIQALGQKQCDIKNHYDDFISIQKSAYNDKSYLIKRIVETDKKSCFSDLINKYTDLLNYILTNFSSNADYQDLLQLTDSIALREA
jgi:hypothetical protein